MNHLAWSPKSERNNYGCVEMNLFINTHTRTHTLFPLQPPGWSFKKPHWTSATNTGSLVTVISWEKVRRLLIFHFCFRRHFFLLCICCVIKYFSNRRKEMLNHSTLSDEQNPDASYANFVHSAAWWFRSHICSIVALPPQAKCLFVFLFLHECQVLKLLKNHRTKSGAKVEQAACRHARQHFENDESRN